MRDLAATCSSMFDAGLMGWRLMAYITAGQHGLVMGMLAAAWLCPLVMRLLMAELIEHPQM
jgi:hypothetical protein